MDQGYEVPTTQRAYTLRLRPAATSDDPPSGSTPKTRAMQEALWYTHEAVNKGAKAFGEWLLTLRGGLNHELAESVRTNTTKRSKEEMAAQRTNRRILLALSWLSVEDAHGAPTGECRVTSGRESAPEREEKLSSALRAILKARGSAKVEIDSWIADCRPSLSAAIREDAVWVNRSALFEQRRKTLRALNHEYATRTILEFFGPTDDYFALPAEGEDDQALGQGGEGPEFRTLARQWISTNFGTGEKSDTGQISAALQKLGRADLSAFRGRSRSDLLVYCAKLLRRNASDDDPEQMLRLAVGWKTGRPSKGRLAVQKLPDRLTKSAIEALQAKFAEEARDKQEKASTREAPTWIAHFQRDIEQTVGLPFVVNRNLIGEYSVMLDHAARRVSIGHSWIKRAEAERRRFTDDAKKISQVPHDGREWLDRFCEERSGITSATLGYRIRPRAIEGWDVIVGRWAHKKCKSEQDRIDAAREAQADPEIDKFGDIQLFEALAADDAICVWKPNGKADPSLLRAYVAAMHARDRQRRFKVPAYRHPDPLRHPVFCDFGNSRWDIRFAVHDREKARRNGTRGSSDAEWHDDVRGLRMGLWTGSGVESVAMRWACKRLVADLALDTSQGEGATPVTRGDRLGRAAAGANGGVAILNVFDEKDWNGRLQAPRRQLDRIASLMENGKTAQAESLKVRLRWLVSFSPRLRPSGPFIEYAAFRGITPNRKGEYYPHGQLNKEEKRQGHAKLILSRLPGLRVLSVDLGHRFAAACAVWEALPAKTFKMEIRGQEIVAGGTGRGELYCHARHGDQRGKVRITIYRRIGPDILPDGTPHPAPWARLDRQFLIKIQGEEKPTRAASQAEMEFVRRLESDLGRIRDDQEHLPRRVDELMAEAIRSLRLGLARHARRAKIAWALDAATRYSPGMGGSETPFTPGDDTHVKLLTNALFDWYALATDRRWRDSEARDLWNQHIASLNGDLRINPPQSESEETDGRTRQQRRKDEEALRERLKPIAHLLAKPDRAAIHAEWRDRWLRDDGSPADRGAHVRATGWHFRLRRVTDWIAGRRYPGEEASSHGWKQNVGGLSLTRIATMRSLYQLHKAFAMRAKPDKARGAPEKGESNAGVARSLLEAMERMREQRVKQIASRIVEAALGIGRVKPFMGRDRKRPQSRVDTPCHAIVIESLRNYRPDELQTRRENRALMNWSAGKVRKYLEEACQLYGLHLREVLPNYTSRQCSRTGLPGIRCEDVPLQWFMTAPWWRRKVTVARKKIEDGSIDATAKFFVDLDDRILRLSEDGREVPKQLRIPSAGGELFVSAPPRSCLLVDHQPCPHCDGKRTIQADLNAAANIGLRALLDPDFAGKWWYIPCSAKDGKPMKDKVAGAACIDVGDSLIPPQAGSSSEKKAIINLWRDPSHSPIHHAGSKWSGHSEYWNGARARVIGLLRRMNGVVDATDEILEPVAHAR